MLKFVEFEERPNVLGAMGIGEKEKEDVLTDQRLYQKKAINLRTDKAASLMRPECLAYTESLIIRESQLRSVLNGARLDKLETLAVHIEYDVMPSGQRSFSLAAALDTDWWTNVQFPALTTLVIFYPAVYSHDAPYSLARRIFERATPKLTELHVEAQGFSFGAVDENSRGLVGFFNAKRADGTMYCDQITRFRATFFPGEIRHVKHMNGLKEYIAAGLWMESLPLINGMPSLEKFRVDGRYIGCVIHPQRILHAYPNRSFVVELYRAQVDWRDGEAIASNRSWSKRAVFERCREYHRDRYWETATAQDGWRTLDEGAHQLVANPGRILSEEEDVRRGDRIWAGLERRGL